MWVNKTDLEFSIIKLSLENLGLIDIVYIYFSVIENYYDKNQTLLNISVKDYFSSFLKMTNSIFIEWLIWIFHLLCLSHKILIWFK